MYLEYLPAVLGDSGVRAHHLALDEPTQYRPELKPSILNEFATAAFRFGFSFLGTSLLQVWPLHGEWPLPAYRAQALATQVPLP